MKPFFSLPLEWKACLVLLPGLQIAQITAQGTPKQYCAHKVTEEIHIDGRADESGWAAVPWSDDFVDIEDAGKPEYRTRMKMVWDDTYLYCLAQLEEKDIWATLKQRDTVIFYNNDFEIFLDPDGDTHNYYELEVNALNTVWDLFLTKPYRNKGKVLDSWDIQGIKSAVHIEGTLNDASDADTGWGIEIAIPWAVLTEAADSGAVPENNFWRLNFSRVNWDFENTDGRYSRAMDPTGKFLPEHNWVWSPQQVINMHEPERWGYVYFTSSHPGSPCAFTIPVEESVKWYLYGIYRSLHSSEVALENARANPIFSEVISGKTVKVVFEPGTIGWNIHTESPFSDSVLVIRDDGQFSRHAKK